MIKTFKILWQNYLKFYKIDIFIVIISLISVSICLLALGKLLQNLIDRGLITQNITATNNSIIFMAILTLLFTVSSFFRSYHVSNLSEKIISKIRINTYQRCLSLKIEQFEELKVGDLITRFSADLDLIAKLITNFLSFFLRNSIMLLGASILMFAESLKLSIIIIVIIPLFLIPLLRLAKVVRNLSKNSLQKKSSIYSDLVESFTNIKIIYAFNQEGNKLSQFEEEISSYLTLTNRRLKIRSLFFASSMGMILLSIIFVIWIGTIDIIKGVLSAGEIISFIYYALILATSAAGIIELFSESSTAISAAERVFELNNLFDDNIDLSGDKELQKIGKIKNIEFKDLEFYYPGQPEVKILNKISFKIMSGNFIGIIGKSGSGKTTLMQLLLKFYITSSGSIKINDMDIAQLDSKNLRSKIAYVPQDSAIFSGSIKSNITFGMKNVNEQDILRIAQITGITDFTNNLAKKLDSQIGERGVKLSGGQKQRIAIARALIRSPEILLLDESTSALDLESEAKILKEIKKIMHNGIVISIAHRIPTIRDADEILILSGGDIMEQGTHQKLLKKSLYYQYVNTYFDKLT